MYSVKGILDSPRWIVCSVEYIVNISKFIWEIFKVYSVYNRMCVFLWVYSWKQPPSWEFLWYWVMVSGELSSIFFFILDPRGVCAEMYIVDMCTMWKLSLAVATVPVVEELLVFYEMFSIWSITNKLWITIGTSRIIDGVESEPVSWAC